MGAFAESLLAYQRGDVQAAFSITRDDGFAARIPVSTFFAEEPVDDLENEALSHCRGRVLDVGACAGRHSLALQRHGHLVTALDVEPACESILRSRGVRDIVIADIMTWSSARFDTVFLLMNGIGMVGTMAGLDHFLARAPSLLEPGGIILCDSIDVDVTNDSAHSAYSEANRRLGRAVGQQRFCISFNGESGAWFDWLHVSPSLLAERCAIAGMKMELLRREPDGHYLARLRR